MMIDELLAKVPESVFLTAIDIEFADYDKNRSERSMERTLCILSGLFPDTDDMKLRVAQRIHALASIWDHPDMFFWKEAGPFGLKTLIDDTIFKVAASHPIQRIDAKITFDPDVFLAAVMTRAILEPTGRGYYK